MLGPLKKTTHVIMILFLKYLPIVIASDYGKRNNMTNVRNFFPGKLETSLQQSLEQSCYTTLLSLGTQRSNESDKKVANMKQLLSKTTTVKTLQKRT